MEQVHIRALDPAVTAERDHILGPADAPVTLVEYGDFECPFCARSYPAVQAIRRQLRDSAAFRVSPLSTPRAPARASRRGGGRGGCRSGSPLADARHALRASERA